VKMTPKKRSPLYRWEQELIDDFYDFQWHLVLDPLYEQFQRWKNGELSHQEMDEAIHKTHKECQEVYSLFNAKRDFLVRIIEFNEDWFPNWVKAHPKPVEE
jgi:hypothetical protein